MRPSDSNAVTLPPKNLSTKGVNSNWLLTKKIPCRTCTRWEVAVQPQASLANSKTCVISLTAAALWSWECNLSKECTTPSP
eukprot:6185123-Amphidinium_carterae.2